VELSIGTLCEIKLNNSVIICITVSHHESVSRFKYLGTSTCTYAISGGILRRMKCEIVVTL